MKKITTIAIAFSLCAFGALAQPGPGRHGGPGGGHPPVLPIMTALDVNKNGELEAAEIASASAVITKTFATNSNGKISIAQLMPQRPGGTNQNQMAQPPRGGKPPVPAIIHELDINNDGFLDASEIAKASTSLLKLDKNGDGKLSADELRPARPGNADELGAAGGPGPDMSDASMPDDNPPDDEDMQEPPPDE